MCEHVRQRSSIILTHTRTPPPTVIFIIWATPDYMGTQLCLQSLWLAREVVVAPVNLISQLQPHTAFGTICIGCTPSRTQLYWPYLPGIFGLHFRSVIKNRTMSMWPLNAAKCKGVLFFFVLREGMRSFIGLYFSISSVRNLTMLRQPLSQLMCNGFYPRSS